jgi:methyl-accepting chemotaxis protein
MLIPMLVALFTSSYFSEKYLSDSTSDALLNIAAEKRNQLELAFADIERHANSVAMQPAIVDILNRAMNHNSNPSDAELQTLSKILQDNFELGDGLFENVYVMYKNKDIADGIGGKSVGWENEEVGSAKALLIRDAKASPTTGRPVMAIVTPILDSGRHLGTLAMAIELNNVSQKVIDSNSTNSDIKTFIINSAGLVISSNNPEYVLTLNFQDEASGLMDLYQTIRTKGSGVGYFTLDGTDYVTGFNASEKYGMYVLTYKPVATYVKPANDLKLLLVFVVLASVLITSVIIYVIANRLTKPILVVADRAEKLAKGDLSVEIPQDLVKKKDELGKLANAFALMVTDLKNIISKITAASEQVARSSQGLYASGEQVGKAAEDVGNTIMDIAAGAQEQSAQIDTALSNLSDLVKQIHEVHSSTETMEKTTTHIMSDIARGSNSVTESVTRINNLKEDTEDVSKVIFNLGNASNQIGQITEVMSGIAAQTNMLALNAAIEAARAGEAGRGFSIVASQIRKLAEESAEASKNIADLVVEIKNGVDIAVNKMDGSLKAVNSSVSAIEENGDIFKVINDQAEQLREIVAHVAQNVRVMAESSRDFELTMQDISKASHEFSANSETVSAASEEQVALTNEIVSASKSMAEMSEQLSSLIKMFKIS